MSTRTPRASAVKAAEFIQAKVASHNNAADAAFVKDESAPVPAAAAAAASPVSTPAPSAAAASSMPPPSDDEAMVDHGGSSEDDMDADELAEEEEEQGDLEPRASPNGGPAGPFADRDDNTLTVEELKLKYSFVESNHQAEKAEHHHHRHHHRHRHSEEESKEERRERKRRERHERKQERRRRRREEAAQNGTDQDEEEEDEEEEGKSKQEVKVKAEPSKPQPDDEDDEDDDEDFVAGEEEESDEEEVVTPLPEPKSSRVGARFQSDLPALLTAEERAAEQANYAAGHPLEGEPNTTVYVPPVETPEEHARRMNELAERQRMQRMMAEAREARRRAAERELEAQVREEQERRRKKEAARAAAAAAAAAAKHEEATERPKHKHRDVLALGAAQLPSDLPSALLHGHILQSFPSSSAPAAAGRPAFQAHYVSLFNEDNQSKLVGVAFDRAEVEEALRGGKQNFRQFLQAKLGI